MRSNTLIQYLIAAIQKTKREIQHWNPDTLTLYSRLRKAAPFQGNKSTARATGSLILGLTVFAISCIPLQANADDPPTLGTITVHGPCYGTGKVPVFSGDDFERCGDPSDFGGGGSGSGGSVGGIGGGGGGGGSGVIQGTKVPVKAQSNCTDEVAEGAAGNAFRIWKLATNPGESVAMFSPDHKNYTVTFSDGRSQTFNWGLPLQASLPLQITNGVCH